MRTDPRRGAPPPGPHPTEGAADWRMRQQFLGLIALAALPLAALVAAHRALVRRKPLVGAREKLTGHGPRVAAGQVLVHGVSLGEVMLMRPLVPRLEAALGVRCLLTTTTDTGRRALDEQFPGHQRAFLPFDAPWAVRRFLARTRPRAVVLLELELWPVLLCACRERGIPVLLLNARINEGSFRGYRTLRPLTRPLLRDLALALAQTPLWGARLAALGVPRARLAVPGSLKADIVRPAGGDEVAALATRFGLRPGQPVLLVASTSAGADGGADEEAVVLGDRLGWWRGLGWRVVVCPRHPERGAAVAALVARLSGVPRRTSRGETLAGHADEVLVVDEIGRLAALYAWTAASGGIAVVGGGLGSGRRGQNMLEAAAAGCCTVVGWDSRNFPDAMALLRDAGGVVEIASPGDLAPLTALADDPQRRARLGARAQAAWRAGQGAIGRTIARVRAACDAGGRGLRAPASRG